jgi:hypothetical protein
MSWIDELADNYSRIDNKGKKILPVTQTRIKVIYMAYRDYSDAVMVEAVRMYNTENEYFPHVINLKPYVDMARYAKPTGVSRVPPLAPFGTDLGILANADRANIKELTDEQRYEIELTRGSMLPMAAIKTETDKAMVQLKEIR